MGNVLYAKNKTTMETFQEQLENLLEEAKHALYNAIDEKGLTSDFSSSKCLKIQDDDLMFNIEGGRYVIEVNENMELVDNSGYVYSLYCLTQEQQLQIIDHLIAAPRLVCTDPDERQYRIDEGQDVESDTEYTFFVADNRNRQTVDISGYSQEKIDSILLAYDYHRKGEEYFDCMDEKIDNSIIAECIYETEF
jgi:hypothetical protein